LPDGLRGVGWRAEFMISSCMIPHTKYDTCKPKKQHTNSIISFDDLVLTLDTSCSFFAVVRRGVVDANSASVSDLIIQLSGISALVDP
jgi:hypothetical protein